MRRSVTAAAFVALGIATWMSGQEAPQQAHWHHVHINSTDPRASVVFYTSKFDCEEARYRNRQDAVWAQKSWLLFNPVNTPAPSEILSPIWHIGWGAENMRAAYDKQVASGTKFETPLTDISDLAGRPPESFFYAYVDGPDHELIELNTANHHHFGHLHLLSADPIAAGEWYARRLGIPLRGKQTQPKVYKGFPVAPAAFLQADNVSIIIYPVEYARVQWPANWRDRKDFEPTKGRVIDHIAFSVGDLAAAISRLKREGVKVLDEPHDVLGAKSAMIEGPDHISIELLEEAATKQ